MSCFQRAFLVIAILLTIGIICIASAVAGYFYGRDQGYIAGEKAGQNIGYNLGFEDGRKKGYSEGEKSGYQLGFEDGRKKGYSEGEKSGYQSGYDSGFTAALGAGYVLRNPTYKELKEFLAEDKTDAKLYIRGKYICSDFATEVNNNAEARGIRCAVVEIRHPGEIAHALVAFQTVDRGLIFIEPQFDAEVTVAVGISYSQVNGYRKPSYDDTIIRILIMW